MFLEVFVILINWEIRFVEIFVLVVILNWLLIKWVWEIVLILGYKVENCCDKFWM